MFKAILKSIILITVFISSLYMISDYMNQGNVDMTAQMGPATYPLVHVIMGDRQLNSLRGYAEPMETSYLRGTLTPLTDGRRLVLRLDKFGNTIESLSFEVRSIDGTRLIERSDITEYEERRDSITFELNIKDLIEAEKEYTFVLLVNTEMHRTIRFYTRIFSSTLTHFEEKINYCFNFHEKSFNKDEARELTQYLEPNASGDNTTYHRVTINSSFHQVTWGNLNVTRITEPVLYVKEMAIQTGSFRIKYDVILDDNEDVIYEVEEFYRIRFTPDRIFLLDFERVMEQVFMGNIENFTNRNIYLGITNPNVPLEEVEGGNVFAFEKGNNLYSMIIPDRKFVRLFGFADEENNDKRTTYSGHRSKILNVDEAGNVVYMVYGYMNRGRHEGRVGISVNYYNSVVNTIDEMVYIPYYKSPELLIAEVEQMIYLNRNNRLFLMLDNEIFAINLENRTAETIISQMQEGSYQISESNKMLVWQDADDIFGATRLNLMNLQDEKLTIIRAGFDEYIKPLGFMGEHLIYGLARNTDISKDNLGNTIFPMYMIKIQNELGAIEQEHHRGGYFITSITISNNMITLHRLFKNDEGVLRDTTDFQIVNQITVTGTSNKIEVIATERFLRIVRLAFKQEIDHSQIIVLTPRDVLFEGGRELVIHSSGYDSDRFYVYSKNGIVGIYLSEAKAVSSGFRNFGVVINRRGEYVWYRGNINPRSLISAIEGTEVPLYGNSLAVCLDAILQYEGITQNTQHLLSRGYMPMDILRDNIPNIQVLDLMGCNLDSILYYLNQHIPVLKLFEDGNAMVLVGYNELNVFVMDPLIGTVYRIGRNDAAALFEENGNRFVTYVRTRS